MADYNVGAVKGSVELNTKQIQSAIKQLESLGKAFDSLNKSSKAASSAASSVSELDKSAKKTSGGVSQLEANMLKLDKKAQSFTRTLSSSKAETDVLARANEKLSQAYKNTQTALKNSESNVKATRNAFLQYERTLVDTREELLRSERAVKANVEASKRQQAILKQLEAAQKQAAAEEARAAKAKSDAQKAAEKASNAAKKQIKDQNLLESALADTERKLQRLNVLEKSHIDLTGQSSVAVQKAKNSIAAYQMALTQYGRSSLEAGRAQRQMTADIQAANIASTQLSKGIGLTRGAFRTIRGASTQFGHQLQDIAVQAQMGTNWLIILGQQGSQLLSLIGGWGALAGAVLAIGAAAFYAFDGMSLFRSEADEALKGVAENIKSAKDALEDINAESRTKKFLEGQLAAAKELKVLLDGITTADINALWTNQFMPSNSILGGQTIQRVVYEVENQDEIVERLNKIRDLAKEHFDIELGTLKASSSQADVIKQVLKLREQLNGLTKEQQSILSQILEDEVEKQKNFDNDLKTQQRINAALKEANSYSDARRVIEEEKLRMKYEEDGISTKEINKLLAAKDVEKDRLEQLKESDRLQKKYLKDLDKVKKKFEDNSSEFAQLVNSSKEFSTILAGWDNAEWSKLFELSDKDMNEVIQQFKTLDKAVAAGDIDKAVAAQMKKGIIQGVRDGAKDTKLKSELESLGVTLTTVITDALVNNDWDNVGETIGGAVGGAVGSVWGPYGQAAGEVIGTAAGKALDDFLTSDWDPTARRQASLGTGTVLGSIDEKSGSIANSMELAENSLGEIVGINSQMLDALRSVQSNIGALGTRIALDLGDMAEIRGPQVRSGTEIGGDFFRTGIGTTTGGISELANLLLGVDISGLSKDLANAYLDGMSLYLSGGLLDFKKILGGRSKKRDEGVLIIGGVLDELITGTVAEAYADFKVKKNVLDDWDKERATQPIDDATNQAFQEVFSSLKDTAVEAARVLGMDVADAVGSLTIAETAVSLEDLNDEEASAALMAYFSQQFDLMAETAIPFFKEFIEAGESAGDVLTRLATNTTLVTETLTMLGMTMEQLGGLEGIEANDFLVGLFGGTEEFQSASSAFFNAFASEADQFSYLQTQINKALSAHNMQLPDTAQGYYDLRKQLELSGKEGAEAFRTLVSLTPHVSEYFSLKEKLESDAQANELKAIQETEQAFLDMLAIVQKALERAQSTTDSAYSDLVGVVNDQKDLLKDQLSTQLEAIKAETQAKLDANKVQIDSAKTLVSAIESELGGLQSALSTLIPEFEPNQAQRRTTAVGVLLRALQTGDLSGTGAAAEIAAQIKTDNFATRASFEFEQAKTINVLDKVNKEAESQLSEAEKTLKALEKLTDVIKSQGDAAEAFAKEQYEVEIAKLDSLLEQQLEQINELRGIREGVDNIPAALAALNSAMTAEQQQQGNVKDAIRQLYISDLGKQADLEGLDYWTNQVTSGIMTLQEVSDFFKYLMNQQTSLQTGTLQVQGLGQDWVNALGIGTFAKGGLASGLSIVGENGPELMDISGAARIHTAQQTQKMLSNSGSDRQMGQMVNLLQELILMMSTDVKWNRRTAQIMERYEELNFSPDPNGGVI